MSNRSRCVVAPCEFSTSFASPLPGSCVSSRSALVAAPCEFSTSPANPLRVSCVWHRSCCGLRTFSLARRASCELATVTTPAWLSAVGGAGAWSVLRRPENSVRNRRPSRGFRWVAVARGRSEFCSCSTTIWGFRQAAGVERPQNSVRNRRPSRGFRRAAALARGASSEFCSQSTIRSRFWAGGGAGAWSALRTIDGPLVVLGGQRRRVGRSEIVVQI